MKVERDPPLSMLAATVVDPLGIPAFFIDPQGKIVHRNAAMTDWMTKTLRIDSSPTLADIIRVPDHVRLSGLLTQADDHLTPHLPLRTVNPDDVVQLTPYRGSNAWACGFVGMVMTEKMPEVSEDFQLRWSQVLDSNEQGLWDINFSDGTRYYSDGWFKLRGYQPSQDISSDPSDWVDRLHPDDCDMVVRHRKAVHDGKAEVTFHEYRERHADGHWIWIMSRGTVVSRDPYGTPTRIIGIDTNVTDLKLGGGQDNSLSQRLQLAVTTSNIGVWEFNIATGIVEWDQRTRAIYGLDDPQNLWPGEIWNDFLHPDDRDATIAKSNAAMADCRDFDIRFRIYRKNDGAQRYLRSHAAHVTDQNGTPKVLGVTWDVTAEEEQAAQIKDAYKVIQERNTALEHAHSEMEHLSNHDALTGLGNRRKLDKFQDLLIAEAGTRSRRCAVLHIDLDRFKTINDTLGHGAGDAVLSRVAQILSDAVPTKSIVARVGGDEFVIMIADAPPNAVIGQFATDIIRAACRPIDYQGHSCRFSLSIGIATGTLAKGVENNLFSFADLALYEAKDAGRGVMRFFSDDLQTTALAKRKLSDDILNALEKNQFGCYYQPQYDPTGTRIIGIEVLARWHHPERGLLTPDVFLEEGEDLGVIAKIDELVLQNALKDAQKWIEDGKHIPQISVNISGKRLLDPLLPDRIAHLADCPHPICFELLETILLDHSDRHLDANLKCIRDLGISIDLDDFGSGHASILGVLNLRPDRIKIDRQLVIPVVENPQYRALIASIIGIGRNTGVAVVAEGVETAEHVKIMRELGCDVLQGYGLCYPLPPDEMAALLHKA